jgi:hypothetical protein
VVSAWKKRKKGKKSRFLIIHLTHRLSPRRRVEEIECILEELTINEEQHGKIVSQIPSRIDDNGTFSLAARSPLKDAPIISFVVGLVLCSVGIHLVLQSVLFEELARSGRKTALPFFCLLESFLDNTV